MKISSDDGDVGPSTVYQAHDKNDKSQVDFDLMDDLEGYCGSGYRQQSHHSGRSLHGDY